MADKEPRKHRALRFVWGLIPWLIVGAILLVVLNLGNQVSQKKARLAAEKKASLKAEAPPTKVILLEMIPRTLKDKINLPATVEPFEELWVRAEVPGRIVKVLVKEGQMVKKGQPIVKLDDRTYRARLARVRANYRYAKAEYKRIEALAKKRVAARSKLESIEAQLKDLTAQLNDAKLALERTTIKAPISGQLNQLKSKEGDLVGVRTEICQLLMFDTVKVTVGVPESDVAAVFDLKEADITIEALGGLKVKGRKVFLSRKPASLARLYNLELAVPNPDGRIFPGMFARVELVKSVQENALAVPLYTIITQGGEKFVFVDNNGVAEKRPVVLGILDGWEVQVRHGLFPGDKVVVVGHRLLEDGQRIEALKTITSAKEIFAQ